MKDKWLLANYTLTLLCAIVAMMSTHWTGIAIMWLLAINCFSLKTPTEKKIDQIMLNTTKGQWD